MYQKFSVLLSVYSKENPQHFSLALKSIIKQTVFPSEVVIVKDGSLTRELDAIIDEYVIQYPNIFKIVALNENQGLGTALQIGVLHCKFDIIARMDTDDIAVRDRFEKQLRVFEECAEMDIVGSFVNEFDGDISNILSMRRVPISNEEICKKAKKRNPFNHMTVMFRRQAVLEAGNYQPFLWNEDYYLWVRMINNYAKMSNIPESLVYARTGKLMFERRGGKKYIFNEVRLQREFLRIGFIDFFDFIINVSVRTMVRLMPNEVRRYIYLNFLR